MSPPQKRRKHSTYYESLPVPLKERLRVPKGLPPWLKKLQKRRVGSAKLDRILEGIFDQELERIEAEVVKDLEQAIKKAETKCLERPIQHVNELLEGAQKLDALPGGFRPLAQAAIETAKMILYKMETDAESKFRAHPSSENYKEVWRAIKYADVLGVDDAPTPPLPYYLRRSYIIRGGDTLSKLAERYYGKANLWDYIYEDKRNDHVVGHPDRIYPGTRIFLP
ncbi:MAG: hypothetical protein V3V49_14945 [Candidatus Krumholzibacteria bacterium]